MSQAHRKPMSSATTVTTETSGVTPTFLRLGEVVRTTGLARSTVYRLMSRNEFPLPCRLGLRAVGWRATEIEQWSAERPSAGR